MSAVLSLLVLSPQVHASVTWSNAEQFTVTGIGYKIGGTEFPDVLYDVDTAGLGNADLEVEVDGYGASGQAELASAFLANAFEGTGSASVTTLWQEAPADVDEVFVGAISSFTLEFATTTPSTQLTIDGLLTIDIVFGPEPEESLAGIRLISGADILWEEALVGTSVSEFASLPLSGSFALAADQLYRLEVYAMSGGRSDSRVATADLSSHWTLDVAITEDLPAVPVPGALLLCTVGASAVGWLSRRRSL